MAETTSKFEQFPPMPDLPDQDWVAELSPEYVAINETTRQSDLIVQTANTMAILESIPDLASLDEDLKEYLAIRISRGIRAAFEGGFQRGLDASDGNTRTREISYSERMFDAAGSEFFVA